MQIEKNIPVPNAPRFGGAPANTRYPFREMEVGDSVLIETFGRGNQSPAAFAMRKYASRSGKKFTLRTIEAGGFIRVWRLA